MNISTYTSNANKDDITINLIKYILSEHGRVMTDYLKSGDKYPNIDGFLEVVDEYNTPIGKLEVQVKTLPKNHNLKFVCPIEPINYAKEISDSPVLFLFGDIDNKKIYWEHISQEYILNLKLKRNQKTKTLYLDKNKYFDIQSKDYIKQWTQIILQHKNKYREYLKNKDEYERIKKFTDVSIGTKRSYFKAIHEFLDFYNSLLDNEFSIIKEIYYPNQWKIGIAYNKYKKNFLSCSFYPISYFENNIQIREMNDIEAENFYNKYTNFYKLRPNPIEGDFRKFAFKLILKKLKNILEEKLLNIEDNNIELYSEIIFGFMDKFSGRYHYKESSKLPAKYYSNICYINEVKFIFSRLLPAVYKEVTENGPNRKFYKNNLEKKNNFDPFSGTAILSDKVNIYELEEKIKNGSYITPDVLLYSKYYPFKTLYDAINILEKRGVEKIERKLIPEDYNRLRKYGNIIWNAWNKDDLENNIKTLIDVIPEIYEKLVNKNFFSLRNELSLSNNELLIKLNLKENYNNFDIPYLEILTFKSSRAKVNVRVAEPYEYYLFENARNNIFNDNMVSYSVKTLYGRYVHLPILNICYDIIKDRLEKYIQIITNDKFLKI